MWPFNDVINLIFPYVCVSCTETLVANEQHICTNCRTKLPFFDNSNNRSYLMDKLYGAGDISAFALLSYNKKGIVQHILQELKYKNNPQLGRFLGIMLGWEISHRGIKITCVVPIPLHRKKLTTRGYNQSEEIAQGIVQVLQVPLEKAALSRQVHKTSFTSKSKVERLKEVENMYSYNPEVPLQGMHVLLVDDVLTTGATVVSCTELLYKAKANKVTVAILAVA